MFTPASSNTLPDSMAATEAGYLPGLAAIHTPLPRVGERISNGEAGRILAGKVWIDEADALHFDYHTRCTVSEGIKAERIEAALREHGII